MRFLVILLLLSLPLTGSAAGLAATVSDEAVIRRLYAQTTSDSTTLDAEAALPQLAAIDTARVARMSDSLRYAYHYVYGVAHCNHVPRDTTATRYHLAQALNLLETRLDVHTIEYADMTNGMGRMEFDAGRVDNAILWVERGLLICGEMLDTVSTTSARAFKASTYYGLGCLYSYMALVRRNPSYYGMAATCCHTAFEATRSATTLPDTTRVNPLIFMGQMLIAMGDNERAMKSYREAQDYLIDGGEMHGQAMLMVLSDRAELHNAAGQYYQALECIDQAVTLINDRKDVPWRDACYPLTVYCDLHAARGDTQKVSEALEKIHRMVPPGQVNYSYYYYLTAGRYDETQQTAARDETLSRVDSFPQRDQVWGLFALGMEANARPQRFPLPFITRLMDERQAMAARVYGADTQEYFHFLHLTAANRMVIGDSLRARQIWNHIIARQQKAILDTTFYLAALVEEVKFRNLVGDYDGAILLADSIIVLPTGSDPLARMSHCVALYQKGMALLTSGQPGALACFADAQQKAKDIGSIAPFAQLAAIRMRGRCLMLMGKNKEAWELLQEAKRGEAEQIGFVQPETLQFIDELSHTYTPQP